MEWLRAFARRLGALFHRDRLEDELADELRFHVEMEADANRAAGMDADEARRAALLKLGGLERTKALYREQRGLPSVESLVQDVHHAGRALRRSPGFTAVAVVSLALGIGANTAIFSVGNALVLRPLPYPEPDQLVRLYENSITQGSYGEGSVSLPNLNDWRASATTFAEMACYTGTDANLAQDDGALRVPAARVEAGVFRALGVEPAMGRVFLDEENTLGHERVAILSHSLWLRQFGGDPAILGRAIMINGTDHVVVGVMPAGFDFPPRSSTEIWLSFYTTPEQPWQLQRNSHAFEVIGRLARGATLAGARAELSRIAARLRHEYPEDATRGVVVRPLHQDTVEGTAGLVIVLGGAVGFVLLLACANVANLALARAVARRRELAVRMAIGAGRLRLIRLLLIESLVLAVAGGLAGLAISGPIVTALLALPGNPLPAGYTIGIDGAVLLYCAIATLAAGLLAGVMPALNASRLSLQTALKEGEARASLSLTRPRSLLAVTEVALALVLVIGAVLMLVSLRRLAAFDLGFNPDHLLTMTVSLPEGRYDRNADAVQVFGRLIERVRAIPGVRSAGLVSLLPVQKSWTNWRFWIAGRDEAPPGYEPFAENRTFVGNFFEAMGIPLVAGRLPTDRDLVDADKVVFINRRLAERYWPGGNPVGQRIAGGSDPPDGRWMTVAGIVGDVRSAGVYVPVQGVMYMPQAQSPQALSSMSLVIRAETDPAGLAPAVRRALADVEPNASVYRVLTMNEVVDRSVAGTRYLSMLLAIFSAVALVLAILGVYGVMAKLVSQRAHEIGVRMALGAEARAVVRLVLGQGVRLALLGIGSGLVMSLSLNQILRGFVIGISTTDFTSYTLAAAAILAVAVAATLLPAWRASRVDPLVALHDE